VSFVVNSIFQEKKYMIDKTISHYKILEKLGEGGMGEVYKAEDTKLKRSVVLKFLPSHLTGDRESRTRFIQEAQAASALDHPNICTIYEIDETDDGQTFIAMAYYDGETLKDTIARDPLQIEEAIDITLQIAMGLTNAHEDGIVHRDIKPGNAIISQSGIVKVVDFGLAKIAGLSKITRVGSTVGTAAYMSPEQARGDEVDHRTDIWSLGVMLYEMLTGKIPFGGEYEQAIIYSILNVDLEPMGTVCRGIPLELERIVGKMLAKNPDLRYRHMRDLTIDLRRLLKELVTHMLKEKTEAEKPKPSIAVLPFDDMSPQKDQDYFCDGIAEEIINALTHLENLCVIARTSAFAFKGKREDIREIGRKLNVNVLLEGSVRKAGNKLRITAQIINVEDGSNIWSEQYDRDMEDVFSVQEEISLAIVDKLKIKLLGSEKAALEKRHTDNIRAYNLYLKGVYFWNKRDEKDIRRGIEYFERAIENDPQYALAYAGLADSYNVLGFWSFLSPDEAFPKAKDAALKALEIDDSLVEGHVSLAYIKLIYDWDWAAAESGFKEAFELNPGYALAHHWYATYFVIMGQYEAALKQIKQALELDPLSLTIYFNAMEIYRLLGLYDESLEQFNIAVEIDPNFGLIHYCNGILLADRGNYKEAIAALQESIELAGGFPWAEGWLGKIYGITGEKNKAEKILNDLIERSKSMYISPVTIASVYTGLGKMDEAFTLLEKACDEHDPLMPFVRIWPDITGIQTDISFKILMKKMGLEE